VSSIPNAAPEAVDEATAPLDGRALLEIVIALAVLVLVARAVLQTHTVDDRSMAPTIEGGQTLLLSRLTFQLRTPQRGELVLVDEPSNADRQVMRRVIGLPGDVIELRGESTERGIGIEGIQVAVNGRPLIEPYVTALLQNNTVVTATARIELGTDEFYVMNDNRAAQGDSRTWGPLRREQLAGRALLTLLPLDALHIVDHDAVRVIGE
jgi:signal peptidase I